MESQSEENEIKNNPYENYTASRLTDTLYGIFGGLFYIFVAVVIILGAKLSEIAIWIFPILYLSGIIFFLFRKRYYISIGLIGIIVIPLLVVGGCMTLIGGF